MRAAERLLLTAHPRCPAIEDQQGGGVTDVYELGREVGAAQERQRWLSGRGDQVDDDQAPAADVLDEAHTPDMARLFRAYLAGWTGDHSRLGDRPLDGEELHAYVQGLLFRDGGQS